LLVSVQDPAFIAGDPDPLMFTTGADAGALPYDIERFDPNAGSVLAWVSVPSMTPDGGASLELWVGRADAVEPDPAEVWQNAGYLAVWHLDDPGAGLLDAAGIQPDGATQGGVSAVSGQIGGGFDFDGVDDWVSVDQTFKGQLSTLTISVWLQVDALPVDRYPIYRRMNGHGLYPRSYFDDNGRLVFQGSFGGMASDALSYQGGIVPGAPQHLAYTYDPGTGNARIFVDGQFGAEGILGLGDPNPGTSDLELGRDPDLSIFLDGTLDELRVSGTIRSDAWITMSHANQANPNAFVTVGASELVPCP
jgi:hypothetical protein